MKKCSKCQCANDDEAKYCRKCGFEFTSMPWWKRIGFIPVRDFKIKNSIFGQIFCYALWIPCLIGLLGFISNVIFDGGANTILAIFDIISCVLVGSVFLFFYLRYFSKFCFRNHLRKRRKELLDSDFIERNSCDKRYAIFARGDKNNNKFGLFDTKRVKMVLNPKYDSLSWEGNEQMLIATIDGKAILIDIKGNEYEM